MPTFKNMKDLQKHLEKAVSDVLRNEVNDTVRKTMQKNIDEVVYESYMPVKYERRDIGGGLIADENIQGTVEGLTLTVENITPFNQDPPSQNTGTGLVGLTEYGDGWGGYNYDHPRPGRPYMNPRPFIQRTREELSETSKLVDSMKTGLKKHGIDAT